MKITNGTIENTTDSPTGSLACFSFASRKKQMRNKLSALLVALVAVTTMFATFVPSAAAKGSVGGGRVSAPRVSAPRTTAPKTTAPKSTAPKSTTPKSTTPKVSTSPKSTTQTKSIAGGAKTQTVAGKTYSGKGYVVGTDYQPKFSGGYTAPAGSVVYYRQSSAMDWLPFYLIWSSSNAHREAVVQEPGKDGQPGKQTVVKEEGTDGMYIWNWIISIIFALGIIVLIVWLINKYTKKKSYV